MPQNTMRCKHLSVYFHQLALKSNIGEKPKTESDGLMPLFSKYDIENVQKTIQFHC